MKNRIEAMMLRKENKEFAMNEDFDRIKKGIKYNPLMEIYSKEYIDDMINHFTETEEYEKCSDLVAFKNERFNHELNYLKSDGFRTI